MDNITHSLAGALLGEATHDLSPDKAQHSERRTLLMTASIIANNFPDIDGIYTRIMPPPLGYLLHHRGHTHTILLLIPQLLLIFGILLLIPSFRKQMRNRQTLKLTSIVVVGGLIIHMMLDSWNSYGVHPFYPISSRWFYGDLVFIIEPFIWFAFSVPLFFMLKSKWTRWPMAIVVSLVPLLAAVNGLLTWYSIGAVFSFAIIILFFSQRAQSNAKRAIVGVIATVVFLIAQAVSAMRVREQMRTEFKPMSSSHRILDLVLSPLPANPFCWSVIQLEADRENDKYITDSKAVSAWPNLLDATSCPMFRLPAGRAEMKISDFKSTVERDCYIDAWLRFARAPFIENSIASDLRFSQRKADNFTNIEVQNEKRECPRFIPPWDRPRQDLLDSALTATETKP